jgi:hypothetical protein
MHLSLQILLLHQPAISFSFLRLIKNAIGLDLNAWADGSDIDSPKNQDLDMDQSVILNANATADVSNDAVTLEALYASNIALSKRVEALEKELSFIRTLLK